MGWRAHVWGRSASSRVVALVITAHFLSASMPWRTFMNKLCMFLGIAVLALALGACGGGGDEDGGGAGSETAPPGPVSIDFWHSEQAASQTAFQTLIDRFNASQDEVKVRLLFQGSPTDLTALSFYRNS